uniref:Uncharacterized protein n=1 Tax=Sphaerodactylus townsendi TaxID=933632 RepID=A0ACB8F597_9SAUR
MANAFVTVPDGYCLSEQIQYYDILPEHISYPLQDLDFQNAPYCQYSTVQFPPVLQTPSSQSQYSAYNLDSQYTDGQCIINSCELTKPTFMGGHNDESSYPGQKRPRLSHSSLRIKGQEELCVVCGDKASGYHYNALTCEGCKDLRASPLSCRTICARRAASPGGAGGPKAAKVPLRFSWGAPPASPSGGSALRASFPLGAARPPSPVAASPPSQDWPHGGLARRAGRSSERSAEGSPP